uniref:MAM and LDL-receptor class A domain-containing protein 1-like n=1 Tax=Crassostrea virginica TaxID=6565 RepID=A0A8B8B4B5_CRAVI|nr:MAM and LDL-receptor class A domain-containing protein 1-like [Crassostrea virginica]
METFARVVLILWGWRGTARASSSCLQFELTGEVSTPDPVQLIANYSAVSRTELFGKCAPSCLRDKDCNAFDICEGECRTIRGWIPVYEDSNPSNLCERHQIECADRYYYDRRQDTCVLHYYCDFESVTEAGCFLTESHQDEFDWSRHTGSTPSSITGPSSAMLGSYYKYIETSYNSLNDRATLQSKVTFEEKMYCLTLYYHMYGSDIKELVIATQNGTQTPVTHWSMTGDQGNVWHRLPGVSLSLDPHTKVLITGVHGSSFEGDIAIDFVELWPFDCPN